MRSVRDPLPFDRLASLLVQLLAGRPFSLADAVALASELLRLRRATGCRAVSAPPRELDPVEVDHERLRALELREERRG